MELWAPPAADTSIFQFVAALSGTDLKVAEDTAASTPYIRVDGATCAAKNTMLRAIAQSGRNAGAMLGTTPLQKAHVAQWLSFAEHQAPKMASSAALDVCNRFLLPRAYLATSGVSLADVAVYFSLHPVVVRGVPCAHGLVPPHPVAAQKDLDVDARAAHCNVTRWFNQTQHELRAKASSADSLPPIVPIELPTARFPNVEAASVAPPADGKGKGQGKGEAKEKKAGKGEKAGAGAAEEGKGGKKADKKAGKKKGSEQPAPPTDMHVGLLDIRVGLIKSCAKHEKADKLYVESIDVGEEKPRDIASGLVGLVPLEEMQDRMVLVLCNMKPRPMVGFKSHGMVLCASNEDHTKVDPVKPPEGSRPGDRAVAKGFESEPASPNFVNKKKVIQTVLPELKTNAEGVACFRSAILGTDKGACTASLPNASIA